jgi:transglutaminase-like putative cysteine protease
MRTLQLIPLIVLLLISSCSNNKNKGLITDKKYFDQVHQDFLKQREIAAGRDSVLFSVFNQPLTQAEKEGLEFLYAYMPLSDLSMQDGNYYLAQVKSALEARSFFNWGKTVPEDIFLHFVLPYRVNNEYTDTARQVFQAELKDRIKHLTMGEAALEVNHWCHEKVIYKGTDIRTSGPLTTVRTAFGRCGEESTFTVAAMRSVGIPARQVYTPRWAHTDDNHAWVEVWIDGKWSYLGACEPEPELNVGWFSEPVKRAMMTHTFVFGKYNGNEEVIESGDRYARLNLLKNYTDTKTLPVKVTNSAGQPIEGAKVEFGLYNYAEFYPIATQTTDKNGYCAVTTGFGDLLVQARMGGRSATAIAKADLTDTLNMVIADETIFLPAGEYFFTPPPRQRVDTLGEEILAANNLRLLKEDSIRAVYISTFIDSLSASRITGAQGMDVGRIWDYIAQSRGNWNEIITFIKGLNSDQIKKGAAILANISEKDLHDIQASTLKDHLHAVEAYPPLATASSEEIYNPYILSPRLGNEFVTPWRSFIQQHFTSEQAAAFRSNPESIRNWITKNIITDTINNYYGVPLHIEGMLQLGRADNYSRDLLFVAISRSFGIPARLETATQRPQFQDENGWNDVFFSAKSSQQPLRSTLTLKNLSDEPDFVPRYYIHYTIARYDQGNFVTLDYETDPRLLKFPVNLSVDTGFYRLITGNRMSGGEVMCTISYFKVEVAKTTEIEIRRASATEKTSISGKANLAAGFLELESGKQEKLSNFMGKQGLIVAIIDPPKEPTKHLMEDIKAVKEALDQWGGKVIFAVASNKLTPGFDPKIYKELPANAVFGHDAKGETASAISTVCGINGAAQWPVVAVINPKGEIIWHSEGYSIGLGDQLVKQVK